MKAVGKGKKLTRAKSPKKADVDLHFEVYAAGLCAMSVCTTLDDLSEIERRANAQNPTGIASRWTIADHPFADRVPNPSPCDTVKDRRHFLLEC